MSFLLQEPKRQNNNQGDGRKQLSVRNSRNNNAAARSIVSDSSRIFPGLGSTSFNRNRKFSQQQISGNQVMLQRQKHRTITNKPQKQQFQQQERQIHQHQEQVAKQEQENLGDYTMDRVMQDLHILEQQQREAKRKLVSAQTNKQKRLDQQRNLNTLLENKNYSNGALRAKLRQSHEFLSVATRELGNRRLTTDRSQDGIADFECNLKRGLQSAKMIQICGAKINSFLIVIEHRVENISRLRMETMQVSTEIRQKYEQTEKEDRMLRLAIQDTHKRARKLGEEKASLRTQIGKLDQDKMIAQNTEQSTELRIQSARDQIKVEADRVTSLKITLSSKIEDITKQRETVVFEMKAGINSLETLKLEVEGHREKIIKCKKVEGHLTTPQVKDVSPVFDQSVFRGHLARLEEGTKKDEDELLTLEKSIENMELADKILNRRNLQNDKETLILKISTKSLTEEEEKRRKHAVDFQVSVEIASAEVAKLKGSFQEMEETYGFESHANLKAISECDVETRQQIKVVENLKLKIKSEDTSARTKIRLFEDSEKLLLLKELEETKKKSLSTEKKFQDLIDISSEESIESKLRVNFELKMDCETMRWDTQIKSLISRCEENLKSFPCLQQIDCTFNKDKDEDKQIKIALVKMERHCTARKVAAELIKEQKVLVIKEREIEIVATRTKLKEKEEAQAQLKRCQFREESNHRVIDAKFRGEDVQKMNSLEGLHENIMPPRRRKGSDLFNRRYEDHDGTDNELTPTNPRQLISSFQSQSSGQRVRWIEGNVGDDDGNERHAESHSKDKTQSDPFRSIRKRNIESRGIVDIDSSCTKTPRTTNAKEQKQQISKLNIDILEKDIMPCDTESRSFGGRRRSQSDSKLVRNRNIKRNRSTSRNLEFDDMEAVHVHKQKVVEKRQSGSFSTNMKFPFDDYTTDEKSKKEDYTDSHNKNHSLDSVSSDSRKTITSEDEYIGLQVEQRKKSDQTGATSLKNTSLETNDSERKIDSRSIHESRSTFSLKDQKLYSIWKGNSKHRSLSPKHYSDTSKTTKRNSRNSRTESREKIHRKSNQDIDISSFKETDAGRKSRRITRDIKKVQQQKPEGRRSQVVCKDKACTLDIMFLEDKKEGKKRINNTSSRVKEKDQHDKRREKSIDRTKDGNSMKGKVHRKKSSGSIIRNRSTDKEANIKRRCLSTNVVQDNAPFKVKHSRARRDKPANVDRGSRGKDREKSSSSIRESSTERGVRKEACRKHHVRTSASARVSSSRPVVSKKSKDKFSEISMSGIWESSSVQGVSEYSLEKMCDKSNASTRDITNKSKASTRAITKGSRGKARGKSSSSIRESLSLGGIDKEYGGKDRERSNTGVFENKSVRREDTTGHASLNARTSSSSQGNTTLKKRKIKGDCVSISSKTTVATRRRKKRNTGMSQRSTATNVRDESCDFNFQ